MSDETETTPPPPPSTRSAYTPERLQRMLADVITNRFPLADVTLLLRAGADPNGPVTRGLRPLHYAAYENNVDVIGLLVCHDADVNLADDLGYTPLHVAARHGHLEAVTALLDLGASVNYSYEDEKWSNGTVSHRPPVSQSPVSASGNSPCAATTDDDAPSPSAADVDDPPPSPPTPVSTPSSSFDTHLTEQPLHLAVEHNRVECAELLLRRGADPNRRYFLGGLINLVPTEHVECLDVLLRFGADPDSFSRGGLTALMSAVKQQNVAAVRILLHHGADVNIQCPPRFDRRRAIHFAAIIGNVEITRLLLDAGAYTTLAPDYNLTPLNCGILHDRPEICRLLLEHGADPNEVNGDECSALQLASSTPGLKYQLDMIGMLLEFGALPNFCSRVFSYVGPSLSALVEYLTYCDNYDYGIIRLFLQYGGRVSFRVPTHLLKIKHPSGILSQLRKLRPHDELLNVLVDAADGFDAAAIGRDTSLSNVQRRMILEVANAPLTLRQLSRLAVTASLRTPSGPRLVDQLPLPPYLKQYLLYNVC